MDYLEMTDKDWLDYYKELIESLPNQNANEQERIALLEKAAKETRLKIDNDIKTAVKRLPSHINNRNLYDIDFGKEIQWNCKAIKEIVDNINDIPLKIDVLNYAIKQWNIACGIDSCLKSKSVFGVFCQNLIQLIESREKSNLAKIPNEDNDTKQSVNKVQPTKSTSNKRYVFEQAFTEKQATEYYKELMDKRYLHPNTALQMWLYVFGLTKQIIDFEPIRWLRTNKSLATLINELFSDCNSKNLWEITSHCFTIQGKKPNKTVLANSISKRNTGWENEMPKDCKEVLELIRKVNEMIRDNRLMG